MCIYTYIEIYICKYIYMYINIKYIFIPIYFSLFLKLYIIINVWVYRGGHGSSVRA